MPPIPDSYQRELEGTLVSAGGDDCADTEGTNLAAGKIRGWNADRGFGFITPDDGGADVFAHIKDCETVEDFLPVGARVEFDVTRGADGRLRASAVKVVR
jgi:CspA family cold shock protein